MNVLKEVGTLVAMGLVVVLSIGIPVAMLIGGVKLIDGGHYVPGIVLLIPIAVFSLWVIGRAASGL